MARTADVLVVGAGPTGLMVAGELAAAGVACLSPITRLVRPLLSGVVGRLGLVPRRVPMAVSGIGIAYPANPGDHRLAGRRAPDLPLRPEPARLYEALRARRFVLVTSSDRLATLAARWGGRIEVAPPATGGTSVLVRPGRVRGLGHRRPGPRVRVRGVQLVVRPGGNQLLTRRTLGSHEPSVASVLVSGGRLPGFRRRPAGERPGRGEGAGPGRVA